MKRVFKICLLIAVLVLTFELGLRFYGLGQWIVYEENSRYEYFQIANLNFNRFGHHYSTNSLGMRASPEITKGGIRILKFGDSVLNGGAKVSDEDNLTSLVSDSLSKLRIENTVLNISSGSWGLENAFEYLQGHKELNPDLIVLVFSSHDYSDNMHFKKIVGSHPNWPSEQPLCAIDDLWSKWLKYRIGDLFNYRFEELHYLDNVIDTNMSLGWSMFNEYANTRQIPLLVYLHPEKIELDSGAWNSNGQKIIQWLIQNDISYVDGIEKGYLADSYVDNIHLNAKGHKSIAQNMFPSLFHSIQKKSD